MCRKEIIDYNSTAYGYSKNDSHKLSEELGYSHVINYQRMQIY